LGVFPKTAMADGKEIKLVFLLGIPEKTEYDASLLVKIYDEIMQIAGNELLVNRLADTASYEELTHYLEKASRTS
jgi:lichenan operon transcriptional antiterminator